MAAAKLRRHVRQVRHYARESRGPRDFLRLLRARYLKPRRESLYVGSRRFGTVRVRPRTTDMSVVGEVLAGAYDAAIRATEQPRLVVDLGAHIGLVSRTFRQAFQQARLIAVEANPANLPLLRANVPDAEIIGRPVAGTHRTVGLTGNELDGWRICEGDELETITLDDLPGSIDLLKIDIEGTEREVFDASAGWAPRTEIVVCECHHPYTANDMLAALGWPEVVALLALPQFGYDLVTVRLRNN